MPIYEYGCTFCGHEFETLQKISDPVLIDCPACGRPTLRKKISAVAFRLKGSGWYETDFKKEGQRNVVRDESAANSTTEGSTKAGSAKEETAKKPPENTTTAKEAAPAAKTVDS